MISPTYSYTLYHVYTERVTISVSQQGVRVVLNSDYFTLITKYSTLDLLGSLCESPPAE